MSNLQFGSALASSRVESGKRIVVVGGGGYCGAVIVPMLLNAGWNVTVFDKLVWYGRKHLPAISDSFRIIQGDVRDTASLAASFVGCEYVLHLACISNDASFELDERLSTSVNLESFEPTVIAAKAAGIRRFVFASSSSVYGVSDSPNVTEEHALVPLTLYNKYKGMCEKLLLRHVDVDFTGVIFRPATVCGYSPRQRLDLSVNILTNHAVNRGRVTVFGGAQLRPNLHIQDYGELCLALLAAPEELVSGEIFNYGAENHSIRELAELVKNVVEGEFPGAGNIPIDVAPSDDLRSYHINSDKIKRVLGCVPRRSVVDAVKDLCGAFRAGLLPDSFVNDHYYNVRTMKAKLAT